MRPLSVLQKLLEVQSAISQPECSFPNTIASPKPKRYHTNRPPICNPSKNMISPTSMQPQRTGVSYLNGHSFRTGSPGTAFLGSTSLNERTQLPQD